MGKVDSAVRLGRLPELSIKEMRLPSWINVSGPIPPSVVGPPKRPRSPYNDSPQAKRPRDDRYSSERISVDTAAGTTLGNTTPASHSASARGPSHYESVQPRLANLSSAPTSQATPTDSSMSRLDNTHLNRKRQPTGGSGSGPHVTVLHDRVNTNVPTRAKAADITNSTKPEASVGDTTARSQVDSVARSAPAPPVTSGGNTRATASTVDPRSAAQRRISSGPANNASGSSSGSASRIATVPSRSSVISTQVLYMALGIPCPHDPCRKVAQELKNATEKIVALVQEVDASKREAANWDHARTRMEAKNIEIEAKNMTLEARIRQGNRDLERERQHVASYMQVIETEKAIVRVIAKDKEGRFSAWVPVVRLG
ncbi:uncharacterized protein B0H18DRAFT_1030619 [Fomitopsis serialis]|uniref:uncharacterized protein n=1 Tax=Fomitopsis serialis TaxID=139415 RepID=UPI002008195F|nr:uncharacterized protein B0H18DRAFT_1030619 [Neoantrodia serialis]KAH9918598.1 hypothetical protein B0H18DRAFT_1030619 [Neoantrodia serialis]